MPKKKRTYNFSGLTSQKQGMEQIHKFKRNKHETWAERHAKLYATYFPGSNISPIDDPKASFNHIWRRKHKTRTLTKYKEGKPVLVVYPWKITQEECNNINQLMTSLKSSIVPSEHTEPDRRSLFNGVIHHGIHLYQGKARLWRHTNKEFIQALGPILCKVTTWISKSLSQEAEMAMSIDETLRIGNTPFTGMASNFYDPLIPNFPTYSALHLDGNDLFCMIIPTGDWPQNEGLLGFPQLKLTVDLRPGDVIIFRSSLLYHMVSKITWGTRNALVLFAHKNLLGQKSIDSDFQWINDVM